MCISPVRLKDNIVNCGKCFDCQINHSNEWAFRVCLEAQNYDSNCFLTLTYDDEHLPERGLLNRRDLQLFLKRLRKHVSPRKIRFFGCGEYGKLHHRPHFHLIIFNYDFDDKIFFKKDKSGFVIYRSPLLEKLWPFGFSSLGEVNFDSARYSAKYLQKDNDFDKSSFICMSTHPGIGYSSINSKLLDTDKIYFNGRFTRLPRYFLDQLSKQGFESQILTLKEKRLNNFRNQFSINGIFSTPDYILFVEQKKKKIIDTFFRPKSY